MRRSKTWFLPAVRIPRRTCHQSRVTRHFCRIAASTSEEDDDGCHALELAVRCVPAAAGCGIDGSNRPSIPSARSASSSPSRPAAAPTSSPARSGSISPALWGQNVIIDNRPGGNTVVASEIVARARPDGYTLIMQINSLTALPAMAKDGLGTISLDQFSPVSLVASLPHVLVVNRSVPAASVKELVALAKASPGQAQLRHAGGRHAGASRRRAACVHGRHQYRARAVQGRGGVHGRGARQSRADGVRFRAHGDSAYPHRRVQGARRIHREAHPAAARRAHHRRERIPGLRHRELVRRARAGKNAERRRGASWRRKSAPRRRRKRSPTRCRTTR